MILVELMLNQQVITPVGSSVLMDGRTKILTAPYYDTVDFRRAYNDY